MITARVEIYIGGGWLDITSSTIGNISATVGFSSNKKNDRIAKSGTLSITLKNNDGVYTPGRAAAHVDWKKGTPIRVLFIKVSAKIKFWGRVNSLKLQYSNNNNTVQVTALDWMYFAAQLPLNIPPLQTNVTLTSVAQDIVAISPVAPFNTTFYNGTGATVPYAFHENTVETTGYAELSKVAMSEWGSIYTKMDGTFVFDAYGFRADSLKRIRNLSAYPSEYLLLEDGSYLLLESGEKLFLESAEPTLLDAVIDNFSSVDVGYGEQMINRCIVKAYPYKPGIEDVLVFSNSTGLLIPAGETIKMRLQFSDPVSRLALAVLPPVFKQYTLLHLDRPPEGVTGILDSGTPVFAGTTTPFSFASGATYDYSVYKFGNASVAFNGTTDYIYSPSFEKYNFRGEDFTVDWWEYRLGATAGDLAVNRSTTPGAYNYIFGYSNGTRNRAYISSNGSSWDIASDKDMGAISVGSWSHYAITRSGNTYRTFKDGVQQDTWTNSGIINPSSDDLGLFMGVYGYLDEFRMIKGYAAWTANFTPPVTQHKMSGINWSVFTTSPLTAPELTSEMTASIVSGGTGLDFQVISSSASNGYLNLDIYATPLEPDLEILSIEKDDASIAEYGYFDERIDMRLRHDVKFTAAIADRVMKQETASRKSLNKVSMVANKNLVNEALFLDCDIGDLISFDDASVTGIVENLYIQAVSWQAIPGDSGTIVIFDWLLNKFQ